jgi:hypothetical protein
MYAGALFLPPVPLGFTPSARSKLLPGAIVAVVYLIWRPVFCRVGVFNFSNPLRILPLGVAGYVLCHALYLSVTGDFVTAMLELQWILYLIVPLLMAWDLGPGGAKPIVKALLACLGLESILAVISSFTGPMYPYVVLWYGPRFGSNVYRAVGTTDSTNSLGGLMAFGALVCLFAPTSVLPIRRPLLVTGLIAAVILSQSKSAVFSVIISFVLVSIVSIHRRLGRPRDLLTTIGSQVLALALVCGVFYIYGDAVLDNMGQDYVDRTALTERSISAIADFDLTQALFGVGFHGVDYINPSTGAWITAHNSYINLIADLGIIGCSLIVSLFGALTVSVFRSRDWHLLAGMVGLLLHFVTEAFIYAPMFVMTIGTLYGIACIYPSGARREISSPSRLVPGFE